ncbi:MAG: succinate dehydrogenase assembly factor 2 [Robiginitomaculum sp.]|nr:MAG: succinate dehydrogenase assembly factor 2 [Robiginitomaculum sp.]
MRETRIKRLIHRANYRGFKEADLILGGFAKAHARSLNDEELDQLETLLAEKDHDIYDWICGVQALPKSFDTPLFARVCAFKPELN